MSEYSKLHLTALENVKKMHCGYVSEAQMHCMRPMALVFCFTDSLGIVLHPKNLFGV